MSSTCEVKRTIVPPRRPRTTVGVDVGIRHLAVLSDGRLIPTIVTERLNVAGLLRNRRLARRLADASLGELRRLLAYKTVWAGTALVEAERFFPSSKICSGCGHVKAKLPLSEREYHCERCGMVIDRDLNAAQPATSLCLSTRMRARSPGMARRPKTPVDGDRRPGVHWVVLDEAGSRHGPLGSIRPAPPTGNGRLPELR